MKYDLLISAATRSDLRPWDTGQKILEQVFSTPKLTPEKIATFGEVTARNGAVVEGLAACKPYWGAEATMRTGGAIVPIIQDFNWKRGKITKSQGAVSFPSDNLRGERITGGIFFQSQFRSEIDWLMLFASWCQSTAAFAGMLHLVTDADTGPISGMDVRDRTAAEDIEAKAWARFSSGMLYTQFRAGELNSIIQGLTNLGWANWFGHDLAAEVDATAIAAAGFAIRQIGDGYLIQVTDDIQDVTTNFASFSRRRAELKALFRDDLFLIRKEPTERPF